MKCKKCGVEVAEGAKFCSQCGANTSADDAGTQSLSEIELCPIPLDLIPCPLDIQSIIAERQDEDGTLSITVNYATFNDTEEDWAYVDFRAQLLSSTGCVIDEVRERFDGVIAVDQGTHLESTFWGVEERLLGQDLEGAHVILSAVASTLANVPLGSISIPTEPFKAALLPATVMGEHILLAGGGIWRTAPDSAGQVEFQAKALLQNLTNALLSQVKLLAEISVKGNLDGTLTLEAADELPPGRFCMISGSGHGQNEGNSEVTAEIAIAAYFPYAAGVKQKRGLKIRTGHIKSVENADEQNAKIEPSEEIGELAMHEQMTNAAWESKGNGKAICRWFVSWENVGTDELAGAIAGYAGGGSFVVERFYAKTKGDKLVSLWIDFTDQVSGKEIDFEECGEKALAACERALDNVWCWNSNDEWGDSDEVILLKAKRKELRSKADMLYLANDSAVYLQTICEKAGLTAAPGGD